MRSSRPPVRSFLRPPCTLLALALVALPLIATADTTRPLRAPAHMRADARAETVLHHLKERRADLAWAATANWTDSRGRQLSQRERQREAVRVSLRLRDTNQYRTAATFAAEIDRQLATAEAALRENRGTRALATVSAEARAEEARILDLRATIAVSFRMDTAAARQLRARSAELAPERLPRRPKPKGHEAPPGRVDEEAASTTGGRP